MDRSLGQIPFGKVHKGKDIEDIPDQYLKWISGEKWFQEKFSELHKNILKELKYRDRFDLHIKEDRDGKMSSV